MFNKHLINEEEFMMKASNYFSTVVGCSITLLPEDFLKAKNGDSSEKIVRIYNNIHKLCNFRDK